MRRLIGISLACLVTSACAVSKMPEESTSHDPGDPACFPEADGEAPSDKPCSFNQDGGSAGYGSEPVGSRFATFEPAACGGIPDPRCSSLRTTGMSLFGKAAWYNLVGRQTASGEILDTVTATAAHRSLPLASYAKVTNLDNGRSGVPLTIRNIRWASSRRTSSAMASAAGWPNATASISANVTRPDCTITSPPGPAAAGV